jgi:hypothetical protein
MLNAKYESYSFRDWIEEFVDTIKMMLPTGLAVVAFLLKGSNPCGFKFAVPVIHDNYFFKERKI